MVGKFCNFRLKLPFISEMVRVRDRATVAMERYQEVINGGSVRVGSGLSDLEKRDVRVNFFQADLLKSVPTV